MAPFVEGLGYCAEKLMYVFSVGSKTLLTVSK